MAKIINKQDRLNNQSAKQSDIERDEYNLGFLQQFRTYSYHHVLLVSNTTRCAQLAMEINNVDSFLHPSFEEKYKPQTPKGASQGEGQYIVLINGMTDGEFLIHSLEIETLIDPSAKVSNPHSSFVEGTMEVVEPKGVRFMNLLKIACDELHSDPSGLTFILKTFFVGYTDEGPNGSKQGQIKQIVETKPFQFVMMDLTGEFTSAGSTYTITFVGQINGAARMPIFSKVQSPNVSGSTIGNAIRSLEKTLNDAAKKGYDQLIAQLDESNNKNKKDGLNYSPKGRMVRYSLNVSTEYVNFSLDNYHIRNTGPSGQVQIATPQGIDIETAISDIMYGSTKVVELMNKNAEQGYKTIFKIESTIDTTMEEAVITYAVKPCKVPVIFKDNRNNEGIDITPDVNNRNVIEFDYIFTGKNIEVLQYDMKMAMGLVFFQSLGSTNNFPGSFLEGSGNITTLGSGSGAVLSTDTNIMRELTIVPTPGSVQDPASRNKKESAKTADFRTFMARQATLESINSKLRIVGNPYFLSAFNQYAGATDGYSENSAANGTARPLKETIPLIRVKVSMPNSQDEFLQDGKNFADEFWYNGYFQVMSIKSIFRDGKFEQELDLITLLFEEMITPSSAVSTPKEKSNTPTASTTSPSSSPAPVVNAPTTKAPTKTDTSAKVVPVPTREQKDKHGLPPIKLTPDEILNCQSIRKLKPYTIDIAKRTFLSTSFTLFQLIAGTGDQTTHCKLNFAVLNTDDKILDNLCALAKQLEELQKMLGHSITINSGFRCKEYNKAAGGVKGISDHLWGCAVDMTCNQFGTPAAIAQKIQKSGMDVKQCITEHTAGRGGNGWLHLSFNFDSRQTPSRTKFFHKEV